MTRLSRARLAVLTLAATCACEQARLTRCQDFATKIAETGSVVMHHPLEKSSFETVLRRVDEDIANLSGIPALDQAKADYKTKMREAIDLAKKASAVATRPERLDANATARAEAAKATYRLMEATNLHCAGER